MLDKTDKEVVRLFYNGYKARAISEKLGITIPSVYYRLQKARKTQEVKRWWND